MYSYYGDVMKLSCGSKTLYFVGIFTGILTGLIQSVFAWDLAELISCYVMEAEEDNLCADDRSFWL